MGKISITWIDVVIVVMFIVVVYMLLTRIFGHSATDLAILIGIFTLIFSNQYKINREMGEMKVSMKHSFERVRGDIDLIKKRLNI